MKKDPESVFLIKFFMCLKNDEIPYCVLRNYQDLPHRLNGSDIDLLVNPDHVDNFLATVKRSAESTGGLQIVFYRSGEFFRSCIYGAYAGTKWGVQIDIHTNETYKGLPFYGINELLNRVEIHNGIHVLNQNDAMMLALLKECLVNTRSRKDYESRAKSTYSCHRDYYNKYFCEYYGEMVAKEWDAYLLNTSSKDLKTISKITQRSLMIRSLLKNPLDVGVRKVKYNLDRLHRTIRPIGFSVAFLGTDGSGKSTIIEGIRGPLESALHTKLNYEHMRPNLFPGIAKLFGRVSTEGPITNPHASKPSGVIGSLARIFYYSLDYIIGYWVKIYPQMVRRPCLFVFDRYYYDYYIDPVRSRIALPKSVLKLFTVLFPEPDLLICLGTDPEVIHSRKPELTLPEVTRQITKLREFCSRKNNAVWIDTRQQMEDSINQALDAITSRMAKRYE